MRYLDSRIALLIQNVRVPAAKYLLASLARRAERLDMVAIGPDLVCSQRMALDEQEEVREHLEETQDGGGIYIDDRKQQVRRVTLAPISQSSKLMIPAPTSTALLQSLLSSPVGATAYRIAMPPRQLVRN